MNKKKIKGGWGGGAHNRPFSPENGALAHAPRLGSDGRPPSVRKCLISLDYRTKCTPSVGEMYTEPVRSGESELVWRFEPTIFCVCAHKRYGSTD